MKFLIFFSLLTSTFAHADELLCASIGNQELYYTNGQVRITAIINNETSLRKLELSTTGSDTLGVSEEKVDGKIKGKYSRFSFSDAWCNYRIALPLGFMQKTNTTVFLDANCEENSNYSLRLNCAVQ